MKNISTKVSPLLLFALSTAWAEKGLEILEEKLRAEFPEHEVSEIRKTPIKQLYEVILGGRIYYVSEDGRYLVRGDVIDLKRKANLTEERRKAIRQALLAQIKDEETIIFSPEKPKHTITVFTDIDCGYCRRFHAQIDEYLKRGVRVRYLFFPRAGKASNSYRKAVAVWCSDNRQEALTKAKRGEPIEIKTCPNPVDRHMELAERFGIEGTPMLVTEDGTVIPGYVPPERLAEFLDQKKK